MQNSLVYENIRLDPGQKIGWKHYNLSDGKAIDIGSHFHMMPEIMKFRRVSGYYTINQSNFKVTGSTLIFAPSMAVHEMHLTADDKEFYLLQFEPSLYRDLKLEMFQTMDNHPLVIELSEEEDRWIDSLFEWGEKIASNLREQKIRDGVLRLLLLFINDKIQKIDVKENVFSQNKTMAKMFPLLHYLEETRKFSISLDEAAKMCGISRFHFSRLFKACFKTNFKDYLLKGKISAAVTLLSSSDLNISEVAYECEFSDTAYFCQKFKEVLHHTPGEFRKNLLDSDKFLK